MTTYWIMILYDWGELAPGTDLYLITQRWWRSTDGHQWTQKDGYSININSPRKGLSFDACKNAEAPFDTPEVPEALRQLATPIARLPPNEGYAQMIADELTAAAQTALDSLGTHCGLYDTVTASAWAVDNAGIRRDLSPDEVTIDNPTLQTVLQEFGGLAAICESNVVRLGK